MNADPEFVAHVAKLTEDVLRRNRALLGQVEPELVASARALAGHTSLGAYSRILQELAKEPEIKKPKRPKTYHVSIDSQYYRLPTELPQPIETRVDVWVRRGKSYPAKLGEIAVDDAICGFRMFQQCDRTVSAQSFAAVEITFAGRRKMLLNAESLVPVEHIQNDHEDSSLLLDFFFDDGRGPFHMSMALNNRHYRRHSAELTVEWDRRTLLRGMGLYARDPIRDDNVVQKYYFDTDQLLVFAQRARKAGISFSTVADLRGRRLIKARDLRRGMKLFGQFPDSPKTSFNIQGVTLTTVQGGICLHAINRMPFYRLDGVPVFAPPLDMTARWNQLLVC